MTHDPTVISTKGACIYCGAVGVRLTDEHIVPYALGGFHIIKKASCLSCANITKRFEQKVARDLWGDARTSFNAPSRRKKQRNDFILMSDSSNPGQKIKVPATEYPAVLVFYKMGLPGFLQGFTEDIDLSKLWTMIAIEDEQRRTEFLKKGNNLTVSFRHVPQEFGQLLMKIGYGQILTALDPNDFYPICLPYILGHKTNVSYLVGGVTEDVAPIPGIGYSLNTTGFISADRMTLIAKIRLHANTYSPEYQVVVGDLAGKDNITRVAKKLGLPKPNFLG